MGSKRKNKEKTKQKRSNVQQRMFDLPKILMEKSVSIKLEDHVADIYEWVSGVFRGVYRFNGRKMFAIDEVDEKNLYLKRRHFYVDDIREIDLEGKYVKE